MRLPSARQAGIVAVLLGASALFAAIWVKNGLFLDMEYYFYQYNLIGTHGYSEAVFENYLVTGKFEFGIFLFYGLLDLIGVSGEFLFLFLMFVALQGAIFLAIKEKLVCKLSPFLLAIILLSHFSFSQYTYFWRQIFGVAVALYGLGRGNIFAKVFLLAFACALHYFSVAVPLVWWVASQMSNRRLSIYIVVVPFLWFVAVALRGGTVHLAGLGTQQIMFEESSYDLVIKSIILASVSLLFTVRHIFQKRGEGGVVDFCLILCLIAFFSSGNQLVIRLFTPASLFIPYILASARRYITLVPLMMSIYPVVGLIVKILFFGLVVS